MRDSIRPEQIAFYRENGYLSSRISCPAGNWSTGGP